MPAELIDGKAFSATLRADVAAAVTRLTFQPRLAVILVSDDPASAIYVRNKDRAATQAGIAARTIRLAADVDQHSLFREIERQNNDPTVDGILVQLPLPEHISVPATLALIDPAKDVDGFHPLNVARLTAGQPELVPCTPRGVMKLLDHTVGSLAGLHAVVLGRSAIVGRPLASLLLAEHATVTVAHSRSRNLPLLCRSADILVAAVGRPELVRGDWIAPGATVIDVGINRAADGGLLGDVCFDEAVMVAGALTPVPGGVGPMTIACLLENTVAAGIRRRGKGKDRTTPGMASSTRRQRQRLLQAFAEATPSPAD